LLFAARSVAERRKGGELLRQALGLLAKDRFDGKLNVLVVGEGTSQWSSFGLPHVTPLGFLRDERLLALAYSAADVFVLPTLADNLPNGLIESLASGTPVVTFNVGGCGEIVRPRETGYLAVAQDPADLARGIRLLLENHDLRMRMAQCCREVAEAEYALEIQASRYAELYREVLAQHRSHSRGVPITRWSGDGGW
jgi:glycosyltransferase involved in cell wall biosynthesis